MVVSFNRYFFLVFYPVIFMIGDRFSYLYLIIFCSLYSRIQFALGTSMSGRFPWYYVLIFSLGGIFAKEEIFEKLEAGKIKSLKHKVIRIPLIFMCLFFFSWLKFHLNNTSVWELYYAFCPLLAVLLIFELRRVKIIFVISKFVGSYSLGIYIIHTEFRRIALSLSGHVISAFLICFLIALAISYLLTNAQKLAAKAIKQYIR